MRRQKAWRTKAYSLLVCLAFYEKTWLRLEARSLIRSKIIGLLDGWAQYDRA